MFKYHHAGLAGWGALVALLAGCDRGTDALPTAPATDIPISLAPPAPNIPVVITIDGAGRITPDAGGSYSDGAPGVSAVIDQYGSLIVDTGPSRTINFNFIGAAVDTTNKFLPNQTGKQSVAIRTKGPNLRTMAVNTTGCSPLAFVFSATAEATSVLYHGYAAQFDNNTTYAYATRTGEKGWTFTSSQPAGASKCGTAPDHQVLVQSQDLTVRKSTMQPKGYYSMPFSFQVAAQ